MSQIFDALQRSEAERAGIDLAELSNATELLLAAERSAPEVPTANAIADAALNYEEPSQPDSSTEFDSMPVSIPPESRLVCLTDKESLAAEKFRFLGVRLRQLQQTRPLKKVLVTSTVPNEGKSMVSANLACTLARKRQQKTLLLEGDLRRSTLARQFGLGKVPGLSEWLQHGKGPMTNIYRLESAALWILPAGSTPQDPLELMQTGALSALMDQLATRFDWIVIDSPPVLPLGDTSVWSRLADGILLVARQGVCERKQLKKGLEALDKSKLLGTLINCSTDAAHSNYYYHYGSSGSSSDKDSAEK
jgi:capsular exopolysaccharide synthesis family protein